MISSDKSIGTLFPKVALISWEPKRDLSETDPQKNKLADYVKIMRCKKDFIPKGIGGVPFYDLPPGKQTEGGRIAWDDARSSSSCSFISGEEGKIDKYF